MSDIACLGILVADLLARPVDALPPRGKLALVDQMLLNIGGCAANTAIDLAKLGVSTAILGKAGVDGLGDFVVRTLNEGGLDTRGVMRDESASTAATMVLVDSGGERTFIHHVGTNALYRESDVRWDIIKDSKILHVAGALVMPGFDGEPMANVLRHARESGLVTSLDTVWDASGKWIDALRPCLLHTDYFMPSLLEARALTGCIEPHDVARDLRNKGVKVVAIKLGDQGCHVQTEDLDLDVPAYKVEAVDGTGSPIRECRRCPMRDGTRNHGGH